MHMFIEPAFQPFAVAATVLAGLFAVEFILLATGASASDALGRFGLEGTPILSGALGWANPGRVSALVYLILLVGGFSATGFAVQGMAGTVIAPLPPLLASILALGFTVPFARMSSRLLGRVLPRDETYVIREADLLGRIGRVDSGPLDQGLPGRVHVVDMHANSHFPRARAAPGISLIAQGEQVLLVAYENQIFDVIPAGEELTG
jgi:hypothetical protein